MQTIDIGELEMGPNDPDAYSLGEYFMDLLRELWSRGEGFSGNRPFGNSGWASEVAYPLVKAGLIPGKIGEAYEVEYDADAMQKVVGEWLLRSVIQMGWGYDE